MIKIRLSPTLLSAMDSAARRSGMTRHKWALTGLDAAAGIAPLPEGFRGAGIPDKASAEAFREETLSLRATAWQISEYQRAADNSWSTSLSSWAALMLAVLTEISELPKQLKRIRKKDK